MDGYNTETSERLHIDFAKMGYRASNKVNAMKQMALYIQRLKAITMHAAYLDREQESDGDEEEVVEDDWWDTWEEEDDDERAEEAVGEAEDDTEAAEEGNPEEEFDVVDGVVHEQGEHEQQEEQEQEPEDMDMGDLDYVGWDLESDAQGRNFCYPAPEIVTAKTPTA
ncbi:hypothetical protein FRC11_012160 [Ceratobasidium sp. 423]|nr:hypothetical protein FRC11_012160 [Ceratobasidium sp. 423]